jgi:hypothetical protein
MQHENDDMMVWVSEKSGIFTVKSAYRLALNEKWVKDGMEGSSS